MVCAGAALGQETPGTGVEAGAPPLPPLPPLREASGLEVGAMIASFVLTPVVLVGLYVKKVLRPGALGKHGLRTVDAHPWWVWLLCGFMVFYCGLVAGFLVALVPAITGPAPATASAEPPLRYMAVMQTAVYAASLGAAGVILGLIRRSSSMGPPTCVQCGYSLVGLTGQKCPECGTPIQPQQIRSVTVQAGLTVTLKSLGLGVLCLLMTLPVVNAVSVLGVAAHTLISHQDIPTNLAHPVLKALSTHQNNVWAWITAGIAVVVAPIQEEVVFRGFLQTSILRLTGRPWASILIASAVFGAAHLGGEVPWYAVLSVFVLGLGIGLAFEKTKSLGTSIAMHVGFNAVNVAIALMWG